MVKYVHITRKHTRTYLNKQTRAQTQTRANTFVLSHARTCTHVRTHARTPKSQPLRMISAYLDIMTEVCSFQANFTPLHIAQMQEMSEMVKLLKDDAT